jgi:uncharacterized protein
LKEPGQRKHLSTILVKPAGPDCNMGCAYCFYLPKAKLFPDTPIHRMRLEVLEQIVKQMMADGTCQVSFGWQGGEPTLMGLPFFQKAVDFQQQYGHGHTVGNSLQTNGLLIDKPWARFLARYRFLVGMSIDGPQHIHDHYRTLLGGQGSWAAGADRAGLLLDSGVSVNALSVVNDISADYPEEIYDFLKSLGFTFMQFIPCAEPDPDNPNANAPFSVPPQAYGRFLCRVFDLWLGDIRGGTASTSVRFFDSVLHSYVGLPPPECTLLEECGSYLVVEHNGDVYSCDFFVDSEWRLGNVLEGRLAELLNSEVQTRFGCQKFDLPEECGNCEWLPVCRGGCPKDRFHNPINRRLNYFCASYRMFFEHADQKLKALGEDWKRCQSFSASQESRAASSPNPRQDSPGRNDPCPCSSGLKYKKCCGR